jgi:type I restriction enzyme, S subunit
MEGWEQVTLGETLDILCNGLSCKQNKDCHGARISRIETIADGTFNLSKVGYADLTASQKQKYRLIPRDILFSHINSVPHVGKTALFSSDAELYHGMNLLLMRPTDRLDALFLKYYLEQLFISGFWRTRCKKSINQASVNQKDIKSVSIPLPPLPEQERIVAMLDEAFAAIDTATANTEKNLANAKELFESEINSVFHRKGAGWIEKTLLDIGKTQTGTTPKKADQSNYGDFIPFVKPGDFNPDGTLDYNNEGLSKRGVDGARIVPSGSVLMVCIGATIGKCSYTDKDITTNQQVNALTPSDGSSSKFIYYQMLTDSFQRKMIQKSQQATLPIINKTKWSDLTVWIPPKSTEQDQIAARFDSFAEESQRLSRLYNLNLGQLTSLKQSLLQKAFTGELTADPKVVDRTLSEASI